MASSPPPPPPPQPPTDLAAPTDSRRNSERLRILTDTEAGGFRGAVAAIDGARVPSLRRPSAITSRPIGVGRRSASVGALGGAEIRASNLQIGVFPPPGLGFASVM